MVDKEMFAAMEDLLNRKLDEKFDEKLKPINNKLDRLDEHVSKMEISVGKLEKDMTYVKVVQLENNVIPRLSTIEKCYIDTSDRYMKRTKQIDRMDLDISVLKQVAMNHSEQLKKAQ